MIIMYYIMYRYYINFKTFTIAYNIILIMIYYNHDEYSNNNVIIIL